MREKLNGNPMAQAGIVLVLLLAVGFMLLKGMGGEEEGEEAAASTEAPVAVEAEATEGVASTTASAVTSPVPAPPLPRPVTRAYEGGQTVVLVIVGDGPIDRIVGQSVERVEAMPDAAVFVVPVKQIARYAAITLGVDVSRVPALVVMRPKQLSEGHPEASVTYGFQTADNAEQAVLDARYDGPTTNYHPE